MSDVRLESVTKRFKDVTAVHEVSLDIHDGEFFVLLGPTGAGKTTTLRLIAGLEHQDEGAIYFDDRLSEAMSPADRDVAFVFQQYSLYPSMSVYDNMAFPLRSPMRHTPEGEIRERVTTAAEKLRITHLLERKTARLSGGEMQRVSIGRAIVREPRIFLMDEPLSNLDAKLRESLRVELKHLQKVQNSTTLFVTHDQIEALTMADRIAVLDSGRVLQIGTPHDIYDRPATTVVAQLVGTPRINLMPVIVSDGYLRAVGASIFTPTPTRPDGRMPALLGIRPEDIQLDSEGVFAGSVALVEPLGVETILHVRDGDHTLLVILPGTVKFRIGELVRYTLAPERLHFFDAAGARLSQ